MAKGPQAASPYITGKAQVTIPSEPEGQTLPSSPATSLSSITYPNSHLPVSQTHQAHSYLRTFVQYPRLRTHSPERAHLPQVLLAIYTHGFTVAALSLA